MTTERLLLVAPSWVGDAIMSEPLIAMLRDPFSDPIVDVLAPPWCAPVYARMRGVRRVIVHPFGHGTFAWGRRREFALGLRDDHYTRAIVLPNSWKSALIPWLAKIPRRTGYVGEGRFLLLNDARRLDGKAMPRLVERYASLGRSRGEFVPMAQGPVLVPDAANRSAAMHTLRLPHHHPIAALCPGAEYGPAKRWPPNQFADLAGRFLRDGYDVWIVGSPNDRMAADAVVMAMGAQRNRLHDLVGKTDLGTAIDLLSAATLVVSNDSGLMHAAAAVGVPLVALFGSSSPVYTPPISPLAHIAKIEIACSPCFARECPLGHFKCMRELRPEIVYNLARTAVSDPVPVVGPSK